MPEECRLTLDQVITSLIVIVLPGTGVIYTLTYGLSQDWRASVIATFGCMLGIISHIVASIIGLAALLRTNAIAFQTV